MVVGFWSNQLYQNMARELTQKFPVAVFLADLRGHGNSGGPRGDAPSAQQVWLDVDDTVRLVKEKYPSLPLFLGGHSSGGGVILNYSGWETSNLVDGYFLIAPFLGGDSDTVQPDQRFVKNVRIWAIIAHMLSAGWLLSHTKAVFFNYPERLMKQDSHIITSYTTTMAIATSPYNAKGLFGKLKKPCALFVGSRDEQFIPEKLVGFNQHLSEEVKSKSSAQLVFDASHLSIVLQAPEFLAQALKRFISSDQ
jgi:acylglycerol lipase